MKLPSFRAARAKITNSADLAAEVDQHRVMLGEAMAGLATLDAARRDVLLSDDDAAICTHEAKAAEARITVARLEARLDALGEQEAEIAAAEAAKALDARRRAIEDRAAEMARWLRDTYPEIARELVDALAELHAVERETAAVNAALADVGREVDHVRGPHERAAMVLGPAEGMEAGAALGAGTLTSLGSSLRLPEITGGVRAPGWRAPSWS